MVLELTDFVELARVEEKISKKKSVCYINTKSVLTKCFQPFTLIFLYKSHRVTVAFMFFTTINIL